MKTSLGVAIAAAAMVLGCSVASATVSSNVNLLSSISKESTPTQNVYWRRWHHRHRHCWRGRWGHIHCRWR